jgi:hypothetical protein
MGIWPLIGVLAAVFALRIAFILAHRDPDSLWYDYEHRGLRFRAALALDLATLVAFVAAAAWSFWKPEADGSPWLGKFVVGWVGWSLLVRFQVHRFPRMNRPGLYREAQMNLVANLVMAVLSTLAATAVVGVWLWWRG